MNWRDVPGIHLLNNRNFIFILAIVGAFVLPGPSEVTRYLMMPALAVAMTMATLSVPNNYFQDLRSHIVPFVAGIVATYVLLGGFLLASAAIFLNDRNLWIGFVLIAAAPPAVAVIPFTAILRGNVAFTLSGTVASYLAALVVTPAIMGVFIGTELADPLKLLYILILLIILPLVASRTMLHFNLHHRLASARGGITDWEFFYRRVFNGRGKPGFDLRAASYPGARRRDYFLRDLCDGSCDPERSATGGRGGTQLARSHPSGHFEKPGDCRRIGHCPVRTGGGAAVCHLQRLFDCLYYVAGLAGESKDVTQCKRAFRRLPVFSVVVKSLPIEIFNIL